MRRHVALVTIVALTLASGPVSGAQFTGLDAPALKSVPERRSFWPGGSVEEVWHGPRSMSLFVASGRAVVEISLTGDESHLDMRVTIAGETRSVDFAALLGSHPGRVSSSRAAHARTAGEVNNAEVLDWIEQKAGPVRLADLDRTHLVERLIGAGPEKGSCSGQIRSALGTTANWLACIAIAAATAGGSLPFCFLIGAGAYYLGYSALEVCDPGGGGHSLICNCAGNAPDCMCCEVEVGDVCTCYCPGEECCEWEDATRRVR